MRNRAKKFTLGFIIVGFVITTLIIFVQRDAINAYHKNLPYVRLIDLLQSQVEHANIWVGQLKGDDKNLNFERDVSAPLSKTQLLLEGMYDGKETEIGTFEKAKDEETRALLKEGIYNIKNLSQTSQLRQNTKNEIVAEATDSTAVVFDTKPVEALNLQLDAAFRSFQNVRRIGKSY